MKKLLLATAVLGLTACQTSTRSVDTISSAPPTNQTGSMAYPHPGTDHDTTFREGPPKNPTGSMGYQGSGGAVGTLGATPPANPTGSMGYQGY